MKTVTHDRGGLSYWLLTFGLFLGLKLTDVIAWSWWWIFAPLWIPLAALFLATLSLVLWGDS